MGDPGGLGPISKRQTAGAGADGSPTYREKRESKATPSPRPVAFDPEDAKAVLESARDGIGEAAPDRVTFETTSWGFRVWLHYQPDEPAGAGGSGSAQVVERSEGDE